MSEWQEDWEEVALGDVAEIINGRAYKLSEWETSGSPVIRLQNLTQRGGDFYFSNLALPEKQYCIKGDLLYMWSATFGPHIWWGEKAIFHYHIWKIEPNERIDKKFLFYLLDAKTQEWKTAGSGMAMIHLTKAGIEKELLSLPPLPEQKKIAEILSGIDHLILATQRRIDRIRTAQVGLANSWQKQISLEKEDGTFGDLIASIDSGWSPACDEVPPKSGEWGVLKVSAVSKGYFCEEESKRLPANLQPRDQYRIKKNDVLITRANGNLDLVGRGAIVEEEPRANLLMSDKILRLNPNPSSDRNFLLLLLNSHHVRQQIETAVGGSTGAKNIGQSLLRQISTSVPISEDQAKIGKLSRSLYVTLSAGKKRLDYLVSLKKGLSSDLLSGRKRVSI